MAMEAIKETRTTCAAIVAQGTPFTLCDPATAGVYLGGTDNPIPKTTLADWRCKGVGPDFIKVGRLVRYRQSALDAWLDSRTQKAQVTA